VLLSARRLGYASLREIHVRPGIGARAYNLSYSGGRDQDEHVCRPSWANSWQDPISTN
jgi:hypothetical protein